MGDQRQGDIYFKKVAEIDPNWAREAGTDIIAEGEATGHKHRVVHGVLLHPSLKAIRDKMTNNENMNGETTLGYLISNETTQIKHDEHGVLKLGKGIFKVVQQRELSGSESLERWRARTVID